ncbi:Uncharacterized protein TCM_025980 [Theobroma cacao]|uniref:Uncharacterized protein n=1 Tax=Theobroma cacao TaxID=3641 RepID=A0A061F046_THECC|nr:Uncharacterized protein TCM_025980 [Theobroma cacao]
MASLRLSYGNHGRKNSSFSSTETSSLGRCKQINGSSPKVVGKKLCLQSRPQQVKLTKTDLVKLKVQMRDSAESLMAAQKAANLTEAEFAQMIMRRNEVGILSYAALNKAFLSWQLSFGVAGSYSGNPGWSDGIQFLYGDCLYPRSGMVNSRIIHYVLLLRNNDILVVNDVT